MLKDEHKHWWRNKKQILAAILYIVATYRQPLFSTTQDEELLPAHNAPEFLSTVMTGLS